MQLSSRVRKIWSDWDLRASILLSLFLQIVLIFCGDLRKRKSSGWISSTVWSAYLLADWVATYALGILSRNRSTYSGPQNVNDQLQAFWAPFLLLHLGGPDTITAFSLEDNELWLRHLLGLVFQAVVAFYAFAVSFPVTKLLAPALPMFLAGLIKYAEKSWALRCASMDYLRKSMDPGTNPGPDYADFAEKLKIMLETGAQLQEKNEHEPRRRNQNQVMAAVNSAHVLSTSYHFFLTLKRLVVDLILTLKDRDDGQNFFLNTTPSKAFEVIEVELSFLYAMFYTKSTAIHNNLGPYLRGITLSCILLSFLLFFTITEKHNYVAIDVVITYVLFGGALSLEVYSVGLLVFSDWAFLRFKRLSSIMPFCLRNTPRWSNLMAQYNLITFCLKDRPSAFKSFLDFLSVKEVWDKFWHTKSSPVTDELKQFIFEVLTRESSQAKGSKDYKHFSTCRGKYALEKMGVEHVEELVKSVEVEFDQSILLWHIATDLCYYHSERTTSNQKIMKAISDYMLYLLVVVKPFTTVIDRITQIRYGDTREAANRFFQDQRIKLDEKRACHKLLEVTITVLPSHVIGEGSKSVFFDAAVLAKELLKLPEQERWKVINAVWIEMLCFAATHCREYIHAKQLTAGGELLTLVWLLMAHLGIGEQYIVEL
ncbi:uncharacterized protein [Typha latifolia]|uniref:uncharacterized protein n=1 Tax=Typha latifolia TaxID=4733 RepID=UPI003C2B5677